MSLHHFETNITEHPYRLQTVHSCSCSGPFVRQAALCFRAPVRAEGEGLLLELHQDEDAIWVPGSIWLKENASLHFGAEVISCHTEKYSCSTAVKLL